MDFRHAFRTIRRNPGYAFTAMLCLALAMGVNTTLFSFLDSIFFRELPVPNAERVVTIRRDKSPIYLSEYQSFRGNLQSVQVAAALLATTSVAIDRVSLRLNFEVVSANYARVLHLGTAAGNWFTTGDDAPSSEPVAVISHHLWQTQLLGDRAALGKRIVIQEQPYRIVGVAPQGFRGTAPPIVVDVWVTFASLQSQAPPGRAAGPPVRLIGRLADGASIEKTAAEMRVVDAGLATGQPHDPRSAGPMRVAPASGFLSTWQHLVIPVLALMTAVCGMVLLIACVNVANLLLSRAASRRRETALRQALGASRARLFREALAEGLLLAGGGVLLGIIAGFWAGRAFELALGSVPNDAYQGIRFGIDWRVALLLGVTGVASAILFSLPPALQNASHRLNLELKGETAGWRSRQREIYSAAQVALSLTLLIGAGLVLRALHWAESADPGFATDRRLSLNLAASPKLYRPEAATRLWTDLLERARAVPGILDATLTSGLAGPEEGDCASTSLSARPRRCARAIVEPNYFEMMRVPILSGRAMGSGGVLGEPLAVVVNQTMARTWWPGEDAVGQSLWFGCTPSQRSLGQVVGVGRDIRVHGEEPYPGYYVSRRQELGSGSFALIVRTAGNPYQWAQPLMQVAANSDANLRIYQVQSLQDALALSLWETKWQAAVLGSLGLLAIVLAVIGLHGVVAFAVSQRTREIGVRMALGASPAHVQRMVLAQGLRIAGIGIAAGLLLSAGTVRWLRSYLYGLSPFDPIAFAAASLAWVAIAILASWYPARRATQVDPVTALKYE